MRNRICTLLLIFIPLFSKAQINNPINGITLNLPCELEYKRTILNQKSYNCVSQDINEYVHSYDFNISDLSNDLLKLSNKQKVEYFVAFLDQIKVASQKEGGVTESIVLNGTKAIVSTSFMDYENQKLMIISIAFIQKENCIMVNHITNNFNANVVKKDLIHRIRF